MEITPVLLFKQLVLASEQFSILIVYTYLNYPFTYDIVHVTSTCRTHPVWHPGTKKFGRNYENIIPNFTYSASTLTSSITAVPEPGEESRVIYVDKPIRWLNQAVPLVPFLVLYPIYLALFALIDRHLIGCMCSTLLIGKMDRYI